MPNRIIKYESFVAVKADAVSNCLSPNWVNYYGPSYSDNLLFGSMSPIVLTNSGYAEYAGFFTSFYRKLDFHDHLENAGYVQKDYWRFSSSEERVAFTTPIGAMDEESIYDKNEGKTVYQGDEDAIPSYGRRWRTRGIDSRQNTQNATIITKFSDQSMVQIYAYTVAVEEFEELERLKYNYDYSKEVQVVAACDFYQDEAENHDPRKQSRNADFESAVKQLIVAANSVMGSKAVYRYPMKFSIRQSN